MTTIRSSTCCSSRISASARKGEGAGFRAPQHLHGGRHASRSIPRGGQLSVGPGRRRRRLPRHGRGDPPAHRRTRRGARSRTRSSALVSGFGMINYDRGLCSRRRDPRGSALHDHAAATTEAQEPDPAHAAADRCRRRRAAASRSASPRPRRAAASSCSLPRLRHGAVSAARGLPQCLSHRLDWQPQRRRGRADLRDAAASQQRAFLSRARCRGGSAWCSSTAGRRVVAHLHGDCARAERACASRACSTARDRRC